MGPGPLEQLGEDLEAVPLLVLGQAPHSVAQRLGERTARRALGEQRSDERLALAACGVASSGSKIGIVSPAGPMRSVTYGTRSMGRVSAQAGT
jgi:hypothetical protein